MSRGIKIQITVPEELLKKIEEAKEEHFLTTTGWFRMAALKELKRGEEKTENIKKEK